VRWLLDTNVPSEVTKPRPDERVLQWLDGLDEDQIFISVVSIAEISGGIALIDPGRGLSTMDGLIAATAKAHHLTLATRNTNEFEG
jgi:toxin FitB